MLSSNWVGELVSGWSRAAPPRSFVGFVLCHPGRSGRLGTARWGARWGSGAHFCSVEAPLAANFGASQEQNPTGRKRRRSSEGDSKSCGAEKLGSLLRGSRSGAPGLGPPPLGGLSRTWSQSRIGQGTLSWAPVCDFGGGGNWDQAPVGSTLCRCGRCRQSMFPPGSPHPQDSRPEPESGADRPAEPHLQAGVLEIRGEPAWASLSPHPRPPPPAPSFAPGGGVGPGLLVSSLIWTSCREAPLWAWRKLGGTWVSHSSSGEQREDGAPLPKSPPPANSLWFPDLM